MGDSFGKIFRVTTWGESHGPAVGVVVEGCPPLLPFLCKDADLKIRTPAGEKKVPAFTCQEIQKDLDRRRPGQNELVTPRQEADLGYIFSGMFGFKAKEGFKAEAGAEKAPEVKF